MFCFIQLKITIVQGFWLLVDDQYIYIMSYGAFRFITTITSYREGELRARIFESEMTYTYNARVSLRLFRIHLLFLLLYNRFCCL